MYMYMYIVYTICTCTIVYTMCTCTYIVYILYDMLTENQPFALMYKFAIVIPYPIWESNTCMYHMSVYCASCPTIPCRISRTSVFPKADLVRSLHTLNTNR